MEPVAVFPLAQRIESLKYECFAVRAQFRARYQNTKNMTTDSEFKAKAPLYKTAYARIGCAEFAAGTCVAVEYSHSNTSHWFNIKKHEKGDCRNVVAYPHYHLERFCL